MSYSVRIAFCIGLELKKMCNSNLTRFPQGYIPYRKQSFKWHSYSNDWFPYKMQRWAETGYMSM